MIDFFPPIISFKPSCKSFSKIRRAIERENALSYNHRLYSSFIIPPQNGWVLSFRSALKFNLYKKGNANSSD
jgi:hypothetical protein